MECKKSFRADLRNKRSLLLEIGLAVALALVVAAFAYTPDEYRIGKPDLAYAPVEADIATVSTEHREPEQVKKRVEVKIYNDVIEIIKNDRTIQTDIPFDDIDEFTLIEPVKPVAEEATEEEIFVFAETMPMFQGGDLNTFRNWMMKNVRFPQAALDNNLYGRVVLSFVIDKQGRLTDIEVLQSPDRSLADEAVRVLKQSPKWSPGKQRNQVVNVRYTLPVDFRLQH